MSTQFLQIPPLRPLVTTQRVPFSKAVAAILSVLVLCVLVCGVALMAAHAWDVDAQSVQSHGEVAR